MKPLYCGKQDLHEPHIFYFGGERRECPGEPSDGDSRAPTQYSTQLRPNVVSVWDWGDETYEVYADSEPSKPDWEDVERTNPSALSTPTLIAYIDHLWEHR